MSPKPYTPTEDEVRRAWAEHFPAGPFDRFLANARAEARREGAVEALRTVANDLEANRLEGGPDRQEVAEAYIRLRADRIEAEG